MLTSATDALSLIVNEALYFAGFFLSNKLLLNKIKLLAIVLIILEIAVSLKLSN